MLLLLAHLALADDDLDLTRSVVLTTSETLAMGGASVGAAVGADGAFYNPAAAATRGPADKSNFLWSSSFGLLSVGPSNPIDLGNVGTSQGWSGGMLNLGLALGWKNVALSAVDGRLRYYQDEILPTDELARYNVVVNETHLDLAGSFWDGRLVAGAGARLLNLSATLPSDAMSRYSGWSAEAGLTLHQPGVGLSEGLVWRQATHAALRDGSDLGVDGAILPTQISLGGAWEGALRPDHANTLPLRVAADLVYSAPVHDGVMLEALMTGLDVSKGQVGTLSPRLGAELEPWPDRLRLRAGGYLEPSRTDLAGGRGHGTGGFELRLFHIKALHGFIDTDLSYETCVDAAPRYLNLSYLGIGTWARRS